MMLVAAWCVGMAVLMGLHEERKSWAALAGTVPGALLTHENWALFVVAMLSGLLYWMAAYQPASASPGQMRAALGRFWQQVAVLLSAGLTFWQAVEVSVESEPILIGPISHAAHRITRRSRVTPDAVDFPGDDGQLTVLLLQQGYLHGASAQQIHAHVRHLEERLAYEEETKKRRDPLWLTILPALLLLNVLWVFVAPMIELVGRSWVKL